MNMEEMLFNNHQIFFQEITKKLLIFKFLDGKLEFEDYYTWACGAAVAQGTHNPLVVGSNPSGPIFN